MRLLFTSLLLFLLCSSCQSSFEPKASLSEEEAIKSQSTLSAQDQKTAFTNSKAKLYFENAEDLLSKGQPKEALQTFLKSYSYEKSLITAIRIVSLEIALGSMDQAYDKLSIYMKDFPFSLALRFLEASYFIRKGDKEKGLEILNKIKKDNPASPLGYYELATFYIKEKKIDEAISVVKELLKNNTNLSFGWALLASLHNRQNNIDESLIAIEKAYHLKPKKWEHIIIYGHLLLLKRKYSLARKVLANIPLSDLIHRDAFNTITRIIASFIGSEVALDQLEKISNDKTLSIPSYVIQRVYLSWVLGREKDVSKWLAKVEKKSLDDSYIDYLLGINQQRLGLTRESSLILLKIPKKSAYYHPARKIIFEHYIEQKAFIKAIGIIDEVIKNSDAPEEYYFLGASVFSEQQKYLKAMTYIKKGFKKYPKNYRVIFLRGVYQEKLGQIEEATKSMREVISKDDKFSSAYNYLGYMYAERGEKLEEAKELITKALALKPGDGYYLDSLGWVYYQKKDYKKALKYLLMAVKVVKVESIIYEHLGDVYDKLSMVKKAKNSYQEALRITIDQKDRKRLNSKIKKLNYRI